MVALTEAGMWDDPCLVLRTQHGSIAHARAHVHVKIVQSVLRYDLCRPMLVNRLDTTVPVQGHGRYLRCTPSSCIRDDFSM